MEYTPDNWVLVKVTVPDTLEIIYKVVAGWSGGYLDGDSWRVNSGITRVVEDDKYYDFHGNSGSVYRCYKESEFVRMNIAGIYGQMLEHESVEPISANELKEILKL